MTWIRTIPLAEADEKLQKALEQRALYPSEYVAPVPDLRTATPALCRPTH
jgi:hypothetical protein